MRKGRPSGCHKVPTNWVRSERGKLHLRVQDTAILVQVSLEGDSSVRRAAQLLLVQVTQNGQVIEWPQNRLN